MMMSQAGRKISGFIKVFVVDLIKLFVFNERIIFQVCVFVGHFEAI